MMQKIIFSQKGYEHMAQDIVDRSSGAFLLGEIRSKSFPDGEVYDRIESDVNYQHVVYIGGTISDEATMHMYDVVYGLAAKGASHIEIICPYFGYSTMERATKRGEIVKAKTRASLLSSLTRMFPAVRFGIYLFDTHTDGLPYYFTEAMTPQHVYCDDLIHTALVKILSGSYSIGTADLGRVKWVRSYAKRMNVNHVLIDKDRVSGAETKIVDVYGHVAGETIVIYDDMIRSGTTIINAAKTYKERGAKHVVVLSTHGILCGEAITNLTKSGVIDKVVVTDSHSNTQQIQIQDNPLFEVISLNSLIYDILANGYNY